MQHSDAHDCAVLSSLTEMMMVCLLFLVVVAAIFTGGHTLAKSLLLCWYLQSEIALEKFGLVYSGAWCEKF